MINAKDAVIWVPRNNRQAPINYRTEQSRQCPKQQSKVDGRCSTPPL
jgi:hypothetical protein